MDRRQLLENWPQILIHAQKSLLHRTDILFFSDFVSITVLTENLLPLHKIKINARVLMRPSGDVALVHAVSSSNCPHPSFFSYFHLQQNRYGKSLIEDLCIQIKSH